MCEIYRKLNLSGRRQFHNNFLSNFVPAYADADQHAVKRLYVKLQQLAGRFIVLTGAGVSTESGIPDYRSEHVGRFARTSQRPVEFIKVVKSAAIRQRFWARNYVAYPTFSQFQPNSNHRLLAEWERENRYFWLITQNVDGLHAKAGSKRLIEMHGSSNIVRCVQCEWRTDRESFQKHLQEINPAYLDDVKPTAIAPDGDVDLPESKVLSFNAPHCPRCSHDVVLPDVVFFGENMPPERRIAIEDKVDLADGLLILGTTLSVQSSYRIVKRMHERKKFIAIVNIGTTTADDWASVRISTKCSNVLEKMQELYHDDNAKALAAKDPFGMSAVYKGIVKPATEQN